ncbi:hypothetical protein Droror1_Dr00021748 [Drosera rotundifolia]
MEGSGGDGEYPFGEEEVAEWEMRDLVKEMGFDGQRIQRRRRRMHRQRRSPINLTLPFGGFGSSSSSSSAQVALSNGGGGGVGGGGAGHVTPSLPARVINPLTLRFLFQKQLQNSDVGPLRRMVLPKKAAETYLPTLEVKEGILMTMDDMDGLHVWSFKYRFWPNNNSRMYVLENTGEFVNAHGLQLGDYIMVYQDYVNLNYVIQAKKACENNEYSSYTPEGSDGLNFQELDTSRSNQLVSWTSFQPDDTCTSFVYDTSFLNDPLMDYWNGSLTSIRPPDNFGSLDNLSFDDF